MKTSDNKGFTLIEVLIAVMVLAIVIVPMLHSFVSSHRVNAKSKQYMRATTLAQDEMEIFEKEKLEDLIDTTKFSYNVSGPDGNGCYVFLREGINNDSAGSTASRFDVEVTLDPERAASSSRYYDTNTQSLFYMNTIGRTDSAVYVQTVRNASNLKSYDDTIYEYFAANKLSTGIGSSWGPKEFEEKLARRIKVKVYQENNGLNVATIVKVTYEYVICEAGVMPAGYDVYSEDSIIFNNSAQSVGDDGSLPELKSVYLFYAPRYKGNGKMTSEHEEQSTKFREIDGVRYNINEDWIVIDNEAKLPIDVYVVRQDIFKEGSSIEPEETPLKYQPKLEIHDGLDSDDHTIGHYYTNLNIDAPPAAKLGSQIDFSSLKDYGNPSRPYSNTEALSVIEPKPLDGAGSAQAPEKDRIYTMTVRVYAHGADRTSATPIVTMTGSKLE